jgi:hypothetical protein
MLANCRDIWERDYAHLALQKKVEKRDAFEEWLYRRKEEDTYRRIPQVYAPYRLPAGLLEVLHMINVVAEASILLKGVAEAL